MPSREHIFGPKVKQRSFGWVCGRTQEWGGRKGETVKAQELPKRFHKKPDLRISCLRSVQNNNLTSHIGSLSSPALIPLIEQRKPNFGSSWQADRAGQYKPL